MAVIHYKFADGHFEDIEVSEDIKREYEIIDAQERTQQRKEVQQKYRAGMRCIKDFSLDKLREDGYDLPSDDLDPIETLIEEEERDITYKEFLQPLTAKQKIVYELFLQGLTQTEIAHKLNIVVSSVNERLQNAQKRILDYFSEKPEK